MNNDLDLIIKQYPEDFPLLNVYAIGDVHVGSEQFDEKAIKKKIQIIADDPFAAVCLCGDLGDYGLRSGKCPTNPYKATMQPYEQQEYIYHLFLPIVDKIAAVVPGNHEDRLSRETGIDPMLTLCCKWDIQDVYRENLAITKYIFGTMPGQAKDRPRNNVFIGITTHGSTRNKHRKYTASICGQDFVISGHIHEPSYAQRGRIVIDARSATAKWTSFKEIVVDAHLTPGGYSLKKEYEIAPPPELQYLELSVERVGRRENRKNVKVMNYHSIQL